jgi:hypothetical protein
MTIGAMRALTVVLPSRSIWCWLRRPGLDRSGCRSQREWILHRHEAVRASAARKRRTGDRRAADSGHEETAEPPPPPTSGRRGEGKLRDAAVSKNSTTIWPRPATNRPAASNCHARDDTGSWNQAVEIRP